MKENKRYIPVIEATSKEQFEARYNKILSLPEAITDQIEKVSSNIGGLCFEVKYNYKKELRLLVPDTTTLISPYGDEFIGIYGDGFFFKIPLDKFGTDCKITYQFIKIDQEKKVE